ncbi:MAG: alanine--tRNA ligase [Elusimicrobiota bacterium]|jgi:alanyl-tRNA synthetase|nr:alanine--tRNA ligase [Elusimicrobiota bacterium]
MNKQSVEIRREFLDFFKLNGCHIAASDSLIPSGDKTLLFTSAGMVQFKKHFLGQSKDSFTRAASCQKCFRTSDIEQVGVTARHLTFFEMLGNFSFGDYFKKEAIPWAWEFLTKNMALPEEKLFITVYKDDAEAEEIWKKIVPSSKITKLGKETNFWNMGDTGPCGPCSEIYFDLGIDVGCKKYSCKVGCDCDRFVEVWNLVFTQFDRQLDGHLKILPRKNIDTGMGLERITAIVQGKKSIFDTDLFLPIIENCTNILNVKNDEKNKLTLRMIADHARAITFLISDGVLPSNEGRGYVLRRILRRALRQGKLFGCHKPFMNELSNCVFAIMICAYPELSSKLKNIKSIVENEEGKFLETLESGSSLLSEIIKSYKSKNLKTIDGRDVFKLHDTYGFPYDLTKEIACECGLSIDEKSFKEEQKNAQKISRSAWSGSGAKDITFYSILHKKFGDTKFVGYDNLKTSAKVLAIIKDVQEVTSLKENEIGEMILSQTSFYGESGGQIGDKGILENTSFKAQIENVSRPISSLFVHKVKVLKGNVNVGDEIFAEVLKNDRKQIARHHSATHLLQSALRDILGDHIAQAGSFVSENLMRFDFTHFSALKKEELIQIEHEINCAIMKNMTVKIENMSINEARTAGATALFGEKYGDIVRVVSIFDGEAKSTYSMELCGGTHIKNTGEIGFFKIISESSVGAGIRRIEATAGTAAQVRVLEQDNLIEKIAELLNSSKYEIVDKLSKHIEDTKLLENEIAKIKSSLISDEVDSYIKNIKQINGMNFLFVAVNDVDIKNLKAISDKLKEKIGNAVLIIVSKNVNKLSFLVSVAKDYVKEGIDASKIAKKFAAKIKGSGGGKPDFAQGGTKNLLNIENAFKNIESLME